MTTHFFLESFDSPLPTGSVPRAGGTDLQERLRTNNARPPIADLTSIRDFAGISDRPDGAGVRVGAGTTIATIARRLAERYPALALTAGGLATPQVRTMATVGGNLTQHTRCWYYRHPSLSCFKSGGDSCPAREGGHLYGVVFDTSPCVHPHPSSIAMALLTYGAEVELASGGRMTVADLLGDGADPTRDNALSDGELITSILLPPAVAGEQAAYFRSISRFEAEWPLVEAVASLHIDPDGSITEANIALGGVAAVPLLRESAAENLVGQRLDATLIDHVSQLCAQGANPLAETAYKVDLIVATVKDVLTQLDVTPDGAT